MPPEGDGVVTLAERSPSSRSATPLVTYPMTGAQMVSALQQQASCSDRAARSCTWVCRRASPISILAKTIVSGNCTSVTVSNVQLNGVALNPAATYNVTVNNFLADGGDNFTTFGTITTPRSDGGSDLQALVNYFGAFSPVAPPGTDRVNELP